MVLMTGLFFLITSCEKKEIPTTAINLDQIVIRVEVGTIKSLTAVFTPVDATNKNIVWESANEAIATVDLNGTITGISLGTTTIKSIAKSDTTINSTCTVPVTPVSGQVYSVTGDITSNTTWYSNY